MYRNYYSIDELYHHGVIGQKWGVRRYQSYAVVPRGSGKSGKEIGGAKRSSRSSSTTRKKNRGPVSKFAGGTAKATGRFLKGTAKATSRLVTGSAKNTKKAYKAVRDHEKIKDQKERESIVKSGDAKLVYRNRHRLSDKELNDAINRINTERRVKDLSHGKAYNIGKTFTDDVLVSAGKTVAKQAIIGLGIYGAQKATRHIIKGSFDGGKNRVNPTMYIRPPKNK